LASVVSKNPRFNVAIRSVSIKSCTVLKGHPATGERGNVFEKIDNRYIDIAYRSFRKTAQPRESESENPKLT